MRICEPFSQLYHLFRFGFRGNPVIFISATPTVGHKQVRLTYLTNWIERKLKEEFKVSVIVSVSSPIFPGVYFHLDINMALLLLDII